jgi:hypothetical protein
MSTVTKRGVFVRFRAYTSNYNYSIHIMINIVLFGNQEQEKNSSRIFKKNISNFSRRYFLDTMLNGTDLGKLAQTFMDQGSLYQTM